MNRKIPFHDLSSLLAESCAITTAEAEDFVRSFFELVTTALVEGEEVTVKGLGTFRRTTSPDTPVEFIADRALADGINAPFAMFEPEVLAPTVTDELLAAQDTATEPEAEEPEAAPEVEPEATPQAAPEPEPVAAPAPIAAPEPEPEPKAAPIAEEVPANIELSDKSELSELSDESEVSDPIPTEIPVAADAMNRVPTEDTVVAEDTVETKVPVVAEEPIKIKAPVVTPASEDDEDEYLPAPERQGMSWGWGFVIGLLVGMAVGACAVYFAIDYIFPSHTIATESVDELIEADVLAETSAALADTPVLPADSIAPADSVAVTAATADTIAAAVVTPAPEPTAKTEEPVAPAPAPKAAPVKDTVKAGYLLPTMARKHYGDKNFWVYIYEENKAVISNPNRIRPGLTVVIPPAEKYGIDARNSASVSRAKDKAAEILRKFPN